MKLSQDEKKDLLAFARMGVTAAANRLPLPTLDLDALRPALQQTGASFVTLTKHGNLRGCIGTLTADQPLALDVLQHAMDAAFDYRFQPVSSAELESIRVEVSVLTEPQPLTYADPETLIQQLRPGVDGVILRADGRRATFLPQVWEKVAGKEIFLNLLCQKAMLPSDAWRHQHLEIQTYRVIHFEE